MGLLRLGHSVGFIARLGTDPFGEFTLLQLEANGIDVGEVDLHASEPTGFQLKCRPGEEEDPFVFYFRSNSAARTLALRRSMLHVKPARP